MIRNISTQTVIESIPFEVWVYDINGNYIYANSRYKEKFKKLSTSLIGENINDIFEEKVAIEIIEVNKKVIDTKKTIKFEKHDIINNVNKVFEIHKSPILNENNEVIGIIGVAIDLTKVNNAKNEIEKLIHLDAQTNLLNRRALYEHLDDRKYNNRRSLLIIDVDNFKVINDTQGHLQGDKILVNIANILKEVFVDDYVFRFGGDEFVVIFEIDTDMETVEKKAQEILFKISNEENLKKTSVSIGIASCICKQEQCKVKEYRLLNRADLALYKAKSMGKNRYVIYDEKLDNEINFEKNLVSDLKYAVINDEINLLYQPLYNMKQKLVGFEALFRWSNEKYKDLPTIELINIMERNDCIIKIGNEILRKSCLFSKKINEISKEKIVVYINMSTIQVMDKNFPNNIIAIIRETKVDPSMIGIEITETVLLENISENIDKLRRLKGLGISISLDDFGTGYTSFNYLVKLPLSVVKIDKTFVDGLDFSMDYANIIKLIVDSSHSLNLEIVAEGVETNEQLEVLKKMNIDYLQGYLFAKPLNENDAIKLIH